MYECPSTAQTNDTKYEAIKEMCRLCGFSHGQHRCIDLSSTVRLWVYAQGRMLAHLEGLLTFSPNLVAASGQFDDVDEAEGAASGGGDQGQDGGRGEGGMNGHGADTTQ